MNRSPYSVEWWTTTNLAAAAALIVGVAGDESVGSPFQSLQMADFPRLRFGLLCDQPLRLEIQVALDEATWNNQVNQVAVAAVWFDAYSLPAPVGDSGFIYLGGPFVRLRLTNTGAGAATSTYFWCQVF